MQLVRVVNEGDKVFSSMWEGNRFTIKPGSEIMTTKDAANRWTGNPDTVNDGKVNERRSEYNRLRVLYGAYERDDVWEANRPHLAVFDLDGNRLTTVLDDPEGTNLNVHRPDKVERTMAEQLEDMERQMEAMRRAMADRENAEATGQARTEGRPSSIPASESEGRVEDGEKRGAEDAGSESIRSEAQPAPSSGPVPAAATEDTPGRVRVGSPIPSSQTPPQK